MGWGGEKVDPYSKHRLERRALRAGEFPHWDPRHGEELKIAELGHREPPGS